MSDIEFSHCIPFLPTADIDETIKFYRQSLLFDDLWIWDDPATVVRVGRGPVKFLFTLDPQHPVLQKGFDIMIFLNGVKDLYTQYSEQGLTFADPLEKKPWGLWEFCVRDNNGYFLRFGEDTKKTN